MTLPDYSRSFLKTLEIVKQLSEIQTDARVAYTKHYTRRGGGCSRNPPYFYVEYMVLCTSNITICNHAPTRNGSDIMKKSFRTTVTISQYWIMTEILFSVFVHFFFLFLESRKKSRKRVLKNSRSLFIWWRGEIREREFTRRAKIGRFNSLKKRGEKKRGGRD